MATVPATIRNAIERAANHRSGVLISGEEGTGRGVLAHAMHLRNNPREIQPVQFDCGIPDSSEVEQELFGSKPARPDRKISNRSVETLAPHSPLARAVSGTIIFRRIEEMPECVQLRLVRLLRDGEARIGSAGVVQVGIRPITIVNPNPDRLVADGCVRADLYKKLSVHAIHIPPLRERREEIPGLASRLVAHVCRVAGVEGKSLTPPAASLLSALPWRGNTVELRSLVEVLVMKVQEDEIDLETVLTQVQLDAAATGQTTVGLQDTLRSARARFEREYIAAVLALHHGRIPETAKALGIQRTNLYRKLRSLRLVRSSGAAGAVMARAR